MLILVFLLLFPGLTLNSYSSEGAHLADLVIRTYEMDIEFDGLRVTIILEDSGGEVELYIVPTNELEKEVV